MSRSDKRPAVILYSNVTEQKMLDFNEWLAMQLKFTRTRYEKAAHMDGKMIKSKRRKKAKKAALQRATIRIQPLTPMMASIHFILKCLLYTIY